MLWNVFTLTQLLESSRRWKGGICSSILVNISIARIYSKFLIISCFLNKKRNEPKVSSKNLSNL